MTFDDLVDRLVSLYDVTTTRAAAVANERLNRMVTEAKYIRAVKSLGTTTSGTASYSLDASIVGILKAKAVYTAGQVNYEGTESLEDLWDIDAGTATVVSDTNAYWIAIQPDSDSDGTTNSFLLSPTPSQSSVTVTGLVALQAATFTYGNSSALPIPVDTHEHLLAGCKAELSDEDEREDLSARFESTFQLGIQKLKQRVQGLGVGTGRHRMRVAGYDVSR